MEGELYSKKKKSSSPVKVLSLIPLMMEKRRIRSAHFGLVFSHLAKRRLHLFKIFLQLFLAISCNLAAADGVAQSRTERERWRQLISRKCSNSSNARPPTDGTNY